MSNQPHSHDFGQSVAGLVRGQVQGWGQVPESQIGIEAQDNNHFSGTIVKVATYNANSLFSSNRLSGRKHLKDLSSKGVVIAVQDCRLDEKRFRKLCGIFKSNINHNQRLFATYSEGPGGTCFIFPVKSYKKIYTVKALGKNCLIISYKDHNDANISICNYYGKAGGSNALTTTKLEEIANEFDQIKQLRPSTQFFVVGDFNVSPNKITHFKVMENLLCLRMGLVSYLNPSRYTRFPIGKQGFVQKRSTLDYIYGPPELKNLVKASSIASHEMDSDHALQYINIHKSKTNRELYFPDDIFDNVNGEAIVEGILYNKCMSLGMIGGSPDEFMQDNFSPTMYLDVVDTIVRETMRYTKRSRAKSRKEINEIDNRIQELWEPINNPNPASMVNQVNKRNLLIRERQIMIDKLEARHSENVLNNFLTNSDRHSSYHFRKNAFKKIPASIEALKLPNGRITVNTQELHEMTYKYFKSRFIPRRHAPLNQEDMDRDNTPSITDKIRDSIPKKIMSYELHQAINRTKNGSSPGPDGVTGRLLKFIHQKIPKTMLLLMQYFNNNGTEDFNLRLLKIIQKPDKNNYLNLKSWRPISLINTITKLYESIMYARLVYMLKNDKQTSFGTFVCENTAYQVGKSTHDAYRELRDMTAQSILNNEDELMVLSLDMSSAFDVIQRDFMENLLKRMNLPDHFLESLFRHFKTVRAKIKGQNTPEFLIKSGVPQGSALSGLLFILCLAVILRTISNEAGISPIKRSGIKKKQHNFLREIGLPESTWSVIISYADDTNSCIQPKIEEFQKVTNSFHMWTEPSGLELNEGKSELQALSCSSEKIDQLIEQIGNPEIKNTSKKLTRFLGHYRVPTAKDSMAEVQKSVGVAAYKLGLLKKFQMTTYHGRLVNANSLVMPIARYALYGLQNPWEMYKKKKFDKLQSTFDNYVKPVLKGHARYQKIKNGGGGCVSMFHLIITTYTYFLKKLITPTTMHYCKVRAVLVPFYIEPELLPLGGKKLWKIASSAFTRAKLPFWASMCQMFASFFKRPTTFAEILKQCISDTNFHDIDPEASAALYNRQVSENIVTLRNYEWRMHLRQAPYLGHWIRHHEYQCGDRCDNINRIPSTDVLKGTVTSFCVKDLNTLRMEMNVILTPTQHQEIRIHIKKYFADVITHATLPVDEDDFKYQFKQIDLAPRFYNAINDGKTGSTKITNIIMKDVEKGTKEIFRKWSMEKRILDTNTKIQSMYDALRPEEGETSAEIVLLERKVASLELHSIAYSERRWIVNKQKDIWFKEEHDSTLITRGMRMLQSLTVSPHARDKALKLLTGNFLTNARLSHINNTIQDPHRKCSICGDPQSDEAKHYFLLCRMIKGLMQAFIEIIQDMITPKCSWFDGKKWQFNTVERFPSDVERLVFFQDLPPEIRGCGKVLSQQIFTTLLCIQSIVYNFRRRKLFRPDNKYILSQISEAISMQEHIKANSTIPMFMEKLKRNPKGGTYYTILYDTLDKKTNEHLIPLQDALLQTRVKHIRSAVFVYASTCYEQHKNSVRARLYTDTERRTHDRLVEKIIFKRTELFNHNQNCSVADCAECVNNIFIHRINQNVLELIKKRNPPVQFNDFIESLRYKRIFNVVIQQDFKKYKLNLEHLKVFDDIRKF